MGLYSQRNRLNRPFSFSAILFTQNHILFVLFKAYLFRVRSLLKTAVKSSLFTVGIGCIVAGSNLLQSNLEAGIILIVLGIALIVLYSFLLEKQTVEKASKLVLKEVRGIRCLRRL